MSDTTTALAIVIDSKYHDKINEIRSKKDRAYPRWMPHINFIFPFVPEDNFDDIYDKLKDPLNLKLFELTFDKINYFSQGKNGYTFHLEPDAQSIIKLREIYDQIKVSLPLIQLKSKSKSKDGNEFHPHCTIGQCSKSQDDLNKMQKELNDWLNSFDDGKISFNLKELCMLKRSPETNDQMVVRKTINL